MSISNDYIVKYAEQIGEGASGHVFQGIRRSDNCPCAVKVIKKSTMSKELLKNLSNEIRTLKMLNHEHIVKLFDIYEDSARFFIVMELIKGGELFDRITNKEFYNEKDAQDLCRILLSALKHCHDLDIVHRDLKPENLLMEKEDDDAQIKLVDFGFADFATSDEAFDSFLGTPMYMAPEIYNSSLYGKPVDMWSFGVITYILLCGYPPFSDERRDRLAARIKKGVFAFHDEYWSNVSEQAKDFISKLLTVDPAQRLTVNQALDHPWLKTKDLEQRDLKPALTQLKDFNGKRRFKGAVQAVKLLNRMHSAVGLGAGIASPRADSFRNLALSVPADGATTSGADSPSSTSTPVAATPKADPEHLSKELSAVIHQVSVLGLTTEQAQQQLQLPVSADHIQADLQHQIRDVETQNEKLNQEILSTQQLFENFLIAPNLPQEQLAVLEEEKKQIQSKITALKKEYSINQAKVTTMSSL